MAGDAGRTRDIGDGRPPVELAQLGPGDSFGEEALRYSLYVGQWFYALAAILLIISARSLKKDWVD